MTNEEAKAMYQDAVQRLESGDAPGALRLFDEIETDRPNSRQVGYYRALCLARLGRIDEAQEGCQRLEGKLEADRMAELKAQISVLAAKTAPPAAASALAAAPVSDGRNIFAIDAAHPVSATQTTVTGIVEAGVLHTGDVLSILSIHGMLVDAPILRMGTADTPINLARAGQKTVLLLQVECDHVAPGARATCAAQQEAYAATVVASAEPAPSLDEETRPELADADRKMKRHDYAAALTALDNFLKQEPNHIGAHRLLARLYLDSPEHRDPKNALQVIRKAYELGGTNDPMVVSVLAQALGETGEPEQGLRFLERLYAGNLPVETRMALNKRIQEFRAQYKLGQVWEFADDYGDVIFEAGSIDEIVKALKNKTLPLTAKCRRDRIGEWRPIEVGLAPSYPQVAAFYQGDTAKKGMNWAVAAAAILLIALVIAAIFMR